MTQVLAEVTYVSLSERSKRAVATWQNLDTKDTGWGTHDDCVDAVELLEDHENDSNDELRPVLSLAQIGCTECSDVTTHSRRLAHMSTEVSKVCLSRLEKEAQG